MWTIEGGPIPVETHEDGALFRFVLVDEDRNERRLHVAITDSALCSNLAEPLAGYVASDGLDAVRKYVDEANAAGSLPPSRIKINTEDDWASAAPSA